MLKHSFYLKDKHEELTSVYYRGKLKGKVFKVYLDFKINPDHWDKDKQLIKDTPEERFRVRYNRIIRAFSNRVEEANDILYEFKSIDHLKAFLKGDDSKYDKSFLSYFKDVHLKRVKNHQGIYDNVKSFSFRSEVSWNSVQRKAFAVGFKRYLEDNNYSINYIGKHFSVIKRVVNAAYEDDIINQVNTSFLKVQEEDSSAIYLNTSELKAIYELEGLKKHYDKARDRFLIGCYTGMRFINFSKFNPMTDINNGMIKIRTGSGTGNKSTDVVIPLHPVVKSILEKYDYKEIPKTAKTQMNYYVKDLAEWAGINEPVTTYKTKGGRTVKEVNPKWKLVASHTARRSFATNAFKAGISPLLIMKITGHRTEKAFMKYIRITAEEAAIQMAQSSFFQ